MDGWSSIARLIAGGMVAGRPRPGRWKRSCSISADRFAWVEDVGVRHDDDMMAFNCRVWLCTSSRSTDLVGNKASC
jgi:hypothetical protein